MISGAIYESTQKIFDIYEIFFFLHLTKFREVDFPLILSFPLSLPLSLSLSLARSLLRLARVSEVIKVSRSHHIASICPTDDVICECHRYEAKERSRMRNYIIVAHTSPCGRECLSLYARPRNLSKLSIHHSSVLNVHVQLQLPLLIIY